MKYLITESQMDNFIFIYLDSQGLVQVKKDNKNYQCRKNFFFIKKIYIF